MTVMTPTVETIQSVVGEGITTTTATMEAVTTTTAATTKVLLWTL